MPRDYIVKDSSIWQTRQVAEIHRRRDTSIHVGIVKDIVFVDNDNINIQYVVEIYNNSSQMPIRCITSTRFGGAYNYEEYVLRREQSEGVDDMHRASYSVRTGDVVLVAFLGGHSYEGVILGHLQHPSRDSKIKKEDEIVYISEFNGIEKKINYKGEYRTTFKGIQTNIDYLKEATDGSKIPLPEYDENIAGSYYEFDKTGSWHVTDAAQEKKQSIKIDKQKGEIFIRSGDISIKIEKNNEKITTTCKHIEINSKNKVDVNTEDFNVVAEKTAKIKSKKIAIGTDGTELLDKITKLIDAISTLQAISPVGPCTPLNSSPTWPQVAKIKSAIQSIKGKL